MPGKKSYLCSDEHGRPWIVKAGDPAFKLLLALPRQQIPVLPFESLRSGELPFYDVSHKVARLAEAARDDPDLEPILVRYVALQTCLVYLSDILRALDTKEQQP